MNIITSNQNTKIKFLNKLHKSNERRARNMFVVEGLKEIEFALTAGYMIDSIYIDEKLIKSYQQHRLFQKYSDKIYFIASTLFEKIGYGVDGYLAIFHMRAHTLPMLKISENSIVVVLERIEKPGNLGAILRTADATGIDAVIVCDMQTDIYNPNVIRSSRGSFFTTQIAVASNKEAYQWVNLCKMQIYAAMLSDDAKKISKVDFKKPTAIVFGTESDGLSDFWIKKSNERIIIPMFGKIDSLNVSVSVAIILYEALKQRGKY